MTDTTSSAHIPYLDGWRGIAVACLLFLVGNTRLWSHSEVAAFGIFVSGLLLLWGAHGPGSALHPLSIAALIVVGAAAHWWAAPAPVRLLVGCGAFALALNGLHRAPGILHRLLEWAPLRRLGVWSFSLYLWQQPFYQLVHREGMHPALGLALSLFVGVVAFHAVEQPARAYLNNLWSGPAPVRSGAGRGRDVRQQ